MVIALDVGGTEFEYILEQERGLPLADQTIWKMRRLTLREQRELEKFAQRGRLDKKTGELVLGVTATDVAVETLRKALLNVKNMRAADGSDVTVERDADGKIPDRFFERITPWLAELSNAATDGASVSVEQGKNS